MLYWKQVWKHMHNLTERDIEKRAVMEFISYFEEQMNMVISQSVKELEERNRFNEIQGLRGCKRIDHECVREAIKTINNGGYSSVPARAGGIKSKEKSDKHPQENTEVV